MSDCSPLRLAEDGQSSPSQSVGSQTSQRIPTTSRNNNNDRDDNRNNRHFNRHNNDHDQANMDRSHSESSIKSGQLKYGAKNVIELFVPVSLCMLIVVGTMKATDSYHYSSQSIIWYAQMMYTDQTVDTGTRVWQSFANAFIMLVFIAIMTTVLILLYKFRCYATIHGWLIFSSLMLLFIFAIMYIGEILKAYNIPMDNYTLAIIIWNFGVVGMICIHWKGPLLLQQGYLIAISSVMALLFIRCLPDWTIWTVLAIVSIWDVFAVLCPSGPLRILVELAQERNESIFPALIYSSTMLWEVTSSALMLSTTISMANKDQKTPQSTPRKSNRQRKGHHSRFTGNKGHDKPSTSGLSSSSRHNTDLSSPMKREQHPVEIHYEDGAQPPEVAFIQPNISSGNSEVWQRPKVRAVSGGASQPKDQRQVNQDEDVVVGREATATELTINFHPQDHQAGEQDQHAMEEERGVKLGLGDFIFYSVLVGKASSFNDWTITLSCYVAILVGLCSTLSLLAIFRKALPALPISIAFGLCSFFLSYLFVLPFADTLVTNQIFI